MHADARSLRGNSDATVLPAAVEGAGVAGGAPERRGSAGTGPAAVYSALPVGAGASHSVQTDCRPTG